MENIDDEGSSSSLDGYCDVSFLQDLIRGYRWDEAMSRVNTKKGTEELRKKNWIDELPLHEAIKYGAPYELVEAILEGYPEAVRATDRYGWLPLDTARSSHASPPVVQVLLDAYPEEFVDSLSGETIIHIAARFGLSAEFVRKAIDSYPEGAKAADYGGSHPLHVAVNHNASMEVSRMLMGANPEGATTCDNQGRLPLHVAVDHNAPMEVLRMLMGANPEGVATIDNQGELPLHLLAKKVSPDEKEDVDKVKLLFRPLLDNEEAYLVSSPRSGETPMHIGARFDLLNLHTFLQKPHCPIKVIMRFVRHHPGQLRERDENGNFPLHLAAANPKLNQPQSIIGKLVKLFPEAAAASNAEGRFPLVLAIESGKKWTVGIQSLTDKAEHVVTLRDEATNLYPFMLAAARDDACITTVYNLLRRCPEFKRYILD